MRVKETEIIPNRNLTKIKMTVIANLKEKSVKKKLKKEYKDCGGRGCGAAAVEADAPELHRLITPPCINGTGS